MAPTPFSETNFSENLATSLVPFEHKTSFTSNLNSFRNSFNNSTCTDVQNILNNSIFLANRDFQDSVESHRNLFSNNFKDQLNKLDFDSNMSFKNSTSVEPFNSLPILRKGAFFQDPFFEECRRQFEKSVQDIVSKFHLSSSLNSNSFMNDAFKRYRNLRDTQLREENQAASIENGDNQHKIVIDVKDFMGGDVKVKSFNNTIRIEGHQEAANQSQSSSSSSKRNFCKEFTIPGPVNMDSVNSTLSSDGVLTITVPKSPPTESTSRVTFTKGNDMTQSPSKRERYVTIEHQQPYDGQTDCDMTQSPSQRYVTINELQPYDGQNEANGPTSQNYKVTYPEEVDDGSCQSYSRNPKGGFWKR